MEQLLIDAVGGLGALGDSGRRVLPTAFLGPGYRWPSCSFTKRAYL